MSEIVNIPDANFRRCILEILNKPNNYEITKEDCENVTEINCTYKKIGSLYGIEYFINLKYLYCFNNQLTSLDLSENIYINELYCSHNQLTSLYVSKNTLLNSFNCSYNEITSLDLSKNFDLKYLICSNNPLTSLKLNKNIKHTKYYKAIITNYENLTIQI